LVHAAAANGTFSVLRMRAFSRLGLANIIPSKLGLRLAGCSEATPFALTIYPRRTYEEKATFLGYCTVGLLKRAAFLSL
jgi:hypothetical protein